MEIVSLSACLAACLSVCLPLFRAELDCVPSSTGCLLCRTSLLHSSSSVHVLFMLICSCEASTVSNARLVCVLCDGDVDIESRLNGGRR